MTELTLQPLLGRWLKTNEGPQWIRALDVRDDGGRLRVRVTGDTSPRDWGEAEAEAVYASSTESKDGSAFVARFAVDGYEVDVEANVNLGLLVVAALTRPRDAACGQFTREFFYRSGP